MLEPPTGRNWKAQSAKAPDQILNLSITTFLRATANCEHEAVDDEHGPREDRWVALIRSRRPVEAGDLLIRERIVPAIWSCSRSIRNRWGRTNARFADIWKKVFISHYLIFRVHSNSLTSLFRKEVLRLFSVGS